MCSARFGPERRNILRAWKSERPSYRRRSIKQRWAEENSRIFSELNVDQISAAVRMTKGQLIGRREGDESSLNQIGLLDSHLEHSFTGPFSRRFKIPLFLQPWNQPVDVFIYSWPFLTAEEIWSDCQSTSKRKLEGRTMATLVCPWRKWQTFNYFSSLRDNLVWEIANALSTRRLSLVLAVDWSMSLFRKWIHWTETWKKRLVPSGGNVRVGL